MPIQHFIEFDHDSELSSVIDLSTEDLETSPPASPDLYLRQRRPVEKFILKIMRQPPSYSRGTLQQHYQFALAPWLCEAQVFSQEAFEQLKYCLGMVNFDLVKVRVESATMDHGPTLKTYHFAITLSEDLHLPMDHHPIELLYSYGTVWAQFEMLISPRFSMVYDESLWKRCPLV